ncbi:DUF423 domain-containing protein [Xanthovirga aplysinae]|uniref:DUF423 domain-containing protein n=1 Tax=Xanthovirga aplysinae TaxID=2529853 RepID=UPI0012BCEEC4|nr:DUF423 domain-containing protein [Xanthovirga aplysinae]MTI32713.1 DUF423 domain-containing protein [Xanthovirga aplysinae]
MQKLTLIIGALAGGLAVMIGAFGAHALKASLEASGKLEVFETGVKYQFYHSLALLLIGLLMFHLEHKWLTYASYSMMGGILIFSGSLYILCLSGIGKWGAVTPIGGLLLIMGWIFTIMAIYRSL